MRLPRNFPSLISASIFLFLLGFSSAHAQSIEAQKAGVVKITAMIDQQRRIGTGFIVSLGDESAYILTASHVVEGATLTVNFYTNPDKAYIGTTRNMQGDNTKGLAVITVEGPLPEGLRSLSLASNFEVKGGENATVIGFRRSPPIQWGILQGILTGQIGADLIVSGAVANEGNSGGPILVNEKVVGVLTEVLDDIGYAVPASITKITLKGWGVPVNQRNSQEDRVVSPATEKSDEMSERVVEENAGKNVNPNRNPSESLYPAESILDIKGVWRDSNYQSNLSHINQDGNSFNFQRRGVLPNGTRFESVGSGTITGHRFTSHYKATYQGGVTSVGDCSGTVSPDGMRMEIICSDSLLGPFSSPAFRQ